MGLYHVINILSEISNYGSATYYAVVLTFKVNVKVGCCSHETMSYHKLYTIYHLRDIDASFW